MKIITSLLLALVARNIQTLLDFITKVDTALDTYIAKRAEEIEGIDLRIGQIVDTRNAAITARSTASNLKAGFANLRG